MTSASVEGSRRRFKLLPFVVTVAVGKLKIGGPGVIGGTGLGICPIGGIGLNGGTGVTGGKAPTGGLGVVTGGHIGGQVIIGTSGVIGFGPTG